MELTGRPSLSSLSARNFLCSSIEKILDCTSPVTVQSDRVVVGVIKRGSGFRARSQDMTRSHVNPFMINGLSDSNQTDHLGR